MFDWVLNTPMYTGKSTIIQMTMQELVTTSMHNYFKKNTKSESNANFQIAYTQVNLTSIRETEIRVEMEKVGGKQTTICRQTTVFSKNLALPFC